MPSFSKIRLVLFLSALSLSIALSPFSTQAATKILVKPHPTITAQQTRLTPLKRPLVTLPVTTHGTYTNTFGNTVLRPYHAPTVPAGAAARCRDATYSFSQSRRGTCSHHGGVMEWL